MSVGPATDRLFEVAYDDLCRIARRLHGSAGITDPAALVHEAYLRFRRRRFPTCGEGGEGGERIEEFVYLMALAMRTVARDRRRRERARKRGGGMRLTEFDDDRAKRMIGVGECNDVHALRETMARLAEHSPEWFAVLVHRDLAGRTIRETARRMRIGESTVRSHRHSALRWLRTALGGPFG